MDCEKSMIAVIGFRAEAVSAKLSLIYKLLECGDLSPLFLRGGLTTRVALKAQAATGRSFKPKR
jgi:hypothetical protein